MRQVTFKRQGSNPNLPDKRRVGRPRFGTAQAKIINDWLDWALNCTTMINGKKVKTPLVEPAETTSWSSRLVLAPKYKSTTAKSSGPDDVLENTLR